MTDWVGRVHEAVKQSGSDKELVVHIPDRLDDCARAGLDPEEWVKRGLVDVIVAENFGENYRLKMQADYAEFLSLTQGTPCRLLAPLNGMVFSDRLLDAPLSMLRAAACNFWDQGVDGLYVAEWFHLWPYEASFYEKLRELPYPSIMAAKDKYYFLLTNTQDGPAVSRPNPLPRQLNLDQPVELELTIADDLQKWGGGRSRPRSLAALPHSTAMSRPIAFNLRSTAKFCPTIYSARSIRSTTWTARATG